MAGEIQEGQTATNPKTGQRIVYRGGQWVNAGTAAGLPRKSNPEDLKTLQAMSADAQQKQTLADRAQEFMGVQGDRATGPGYGEVRLPSWLGHGNINPARAFQNTFNPGNAAALQQMDSIANQTFPLMRPAGQGRLLEVEAKAFKAAFPNAANYGDANQGITDRLSHEALWNNAKLQYIQTFVHNGGGTVADAQAAWQRRLELNKRPDLKYAGGYQGRGQALPKKGDPQQQAITIDIHGRPVQ